MLFERKVKNTPPIFAKLHFVHFLYNIVYTLSCFNLLSSRSGHAVFTQLPSYFLTRSLDSHVHIAQFPRSFFYMYAICTNFSFRARFMAVRCYFRPIFSISRLFSSRTCISAQNVLYYIQSLRRPARRPIPSKGTYPHP